MLSSILNVIGIKAAANANLLLMAFQVLVLAIFVVLSLVHVAGTSGAGGLLSIAPGVSTGFETHLALTGADRYGVENLANLDRMPRHGATLTVGLIPYLNGSGGSARVFSRW